MNFLTHGQAVQIIRGCWMLISVIWFIGLLFTKRTAMPQSWQSSIAYFSLLLVSLLLLFDDTPLPDSRLIRHRPETIGVILLCAGFLVAVWSCVILARNWSGAVVIKEGHELVIRGPYRFVRHPMYTGLLLMVIGTSLVRGTVQALVAAVIFLSIHIWKIQAEESLLTQNFPQSYPAYKTRTKALLPFLF